MDEHQSFSDYQRICRVLEILFDDVLFVPRNQDFSDLNPERDGTKRRILKEEARWNWRDLVFRSFQCSTPSSDHCHCISEFILENECMPCFCCQLNEKWNIGRWIPLNRQECYAWWSYYWAGRWTQEAGCAIQKIVRTFERWGIFERE